MKRRGPTQVQSKEDGWRCNGCLLASHGMIALGANLDKAMWLAVELETLARQYYLSLALDSRIILSDEEDRRHRKGVLHLRVADAQAEQGPRDGKGGPAPRRETA